MKKINIRHRGNPAKITVRKIVAVVFFAMFLNMVNIGAFAGFGNTIRPSKAVLELENKLGRIYSVVNFPAKIVSDLFNEAKTLSDNGGPEDKSGGSTVFALLVPVKQTKKSGNSLYTDAITPNAASGWGNKLVQKWNSAYLTRIPPGYIGSITDTLALSGFVRCMLLLLIIMLVLPRGIPVKIKKFINIFFAYFPSLF